MVASRQVEIPFCWGFGRHRGRGFGALAQVIGRTAIPFLRKYIVLAAKRVGADLLEFAVVEKISRQLQRVCEDKLWENNWEVVAIKEVFAESFQQNLQNNPFGREETFLQTFLINDVDQFSVPTFCGICWKSWRESPSTWRCLVVPRTRNLSYYLTWWKLHRVWISKGWELIPWFETDLLDSETEICQGSRCCETYNSKEVETEQKNKLKRM